MMTPYDDNFVSGCLFGFDDQQKPRGARSAVALMYPADDNRRPEAQADQA
jgi:hypothetical protein